MEKIAIGKRELSKIIEKKSLSGKETNALFKNKHLHSTH